MSELSLYSLWMFEAPSPQWTLATGLWPMLWEGHLLCQHPGWECCCSWCLQMLLSIKTLRSRCKEMFLHSEVRTSSQSFLRVSAVF